MRENEIHVKVCRAANKELSNAYWFVEHSYIPRHRKIDRAKNCWIVKWNRIIRSFVAFVSWSGVFWIITMINCRKIKSISFPNTDKWAFLFQPTALQEPIHLIMRMYWKRKTIGSRSEIQVICAVKNTLRLLLAGGSCDKAMVIKQAMVKENMIALSCMWFKTTSAYLSHTLLLYSKGKASGAFRWPHYELLWPGS